MNQIPINEEKNPIYNKKALKIILLLIILGIITGVLLSIYFVNEANIKIEGPYGDFVIHYNLTFSDIFLPSIGVIIFCISIFLLIGLIITYIKIFIKTGSKYITGILFFLTPLFIQSIFLINTLRSLFISPAIPDELRSIRESIGFGFGGLGWIIVMISIFEIIGLSILLYLSSE